MESRDITINRNYRLSSEELQIVKDDTVQSCAYIICKRLASCFAFNGPLRHYVGLSKGVTQREGEREDITDERKMSKPALSHLLQAHN